MQFGSVRLEQLNEEKFNDLRPVEQSSNMPVKNWEELRRAMMQRHMLGSKDDKEIYLQLASHSEPNFVQLYLDIGEAAQIVCRDLAHNLNDSGARVAQHEKDENNANVLHNIAELYADELEINKREDVLTYLTPRSTPMASLM